jgi:thioredoxin-like negative regulator of GroEL
LFEQLKTEYPNVIFETIDIDMNKDAAIENGVTGIPTVIVENNGQSKRFVGVQPKTVYINAIK